MPNVRFRYGTATGVYFANGDFVVANSPATDKLLLARAGLPSDAPIAATLSADDVENLKTAARTGAND